MKDVIAYSESKLPCGTMNATSAVVEATSFNFHVEKHVKGEQISPSYVAALWLPDPLFFKLGHYFYPRPW